MCARFGDAGQVVAGSLTLIAVRRRGPAVSEGGAVHEHEQVRHHGRRTRGPLACRRVRFHDALRLDRHDLLRDGRASDRRDAARRSERPRRRPVDCRVLERTAAGSRASEVVVDVLDNASNPSQAVQNIQRFIGDSKYVGILGSGNAAAAVATGPLASQAGIPFIALSPPTNSHRAAQPYVYVLTADVTPVRVQRSRVPAQARDQEGLADGRQRRLRPGRPGAGRRSSRASTGSRSWTRRSSPPRRRTSRPS